MKKTFLNFAIISSMMFAVACGNNPNANDDAVDTAQKMNDQMEDANTNAVSSSDADFAVKATDAGLAEVEMGKLAVSKATNPDVKAYAQMMVDDHTQANDRLMAIAGNKGITLPANMGDDHKRHMDDLAKKNGRDFDKAYMDMMAADHDKVVSMFKKGSEDLQDADLRAFANETLPVLNKHQEQAKALRDRLK
jgi:putative membrane protein